LSGSAWTAARPEICTGLNLDRDPRQALERLGGQLDSAYRQTAERLPENVALEIAELAGADRPDLAKLEALHEPEPLSALRATTTAMLPTGVAFSEVLLEVCRWTGFADPFTHLSEGRARAEDLHTSICAVLLAEACNISLAEIANPGIPALSPNRLAWVSQNYVRSETIAAANELLLDVYRRIPLVQALGDGHIATVDGMRFRVPIRSIHPATSAPCPLSPSSAGSPRPCTYSHGSTANNSAARPASGSTATRADTPSPGSSSTATKASCASPTAKAKKTNSARSASRSTRSCSGTPNTSTTPSPSYAPPGTRSPTKTSGGSHRCSTSTSRSSATSPSPCPKTSQPAHGDNYASSTKRLSVRSCSYYREACTRRAGALSTQSWSQGDRTFVSYARVLPR
jgi:hypothetical protein